MSTDIDPPTQTELLTGLHQRFATFFRGPPSLVPNKLSSLTISPIAFSYVEPTSISPNQINRELVNTEQMT